MRGVPKRIPSLINIMRFNQLHIRPYACGICSKTYFRRYLLVKHLVTTHKLEIINYHIGHPTKDEGAKQTEAPVIPY